MKKNYKFTMTNTSATGDYSLEIYWKESGLKIPEGKKEAIAEVISKEFDDLKWKKIKTLTKKEVV